MGVFGHEFLGANANFGFDASAAECADGIAIAQDEHAGAGVLGCAAARADDGAQCDNLAEINPADDLGEEFDQTGFSESACGRRGIIAEKGRKWRKMWIAMI